jgi:hypothetical protein
MGLNAGTLQFWKYKLKKPESRRTASPPAA